MQKQTIQIAVQTKNGIVQRIGRSYINQPKTNYQGKGTIWREDKKPLKKATP